MDDKAEAKYQTVIRRLQSDLLAAEMREQFYAETLVNYAQKFKEMKANVKRTKTNGRSKAANEDGNSKA